MDWFEEAKKQVRRAKDAYDLAQVKRYIVWLGYDALLTCSETERLEKMIETKRAKIAAAK